MPIAFRLHIVMARQRVRGRELAQRIGMTEANLSRLRNGRVRELRLDTLESLCRELGVQPGDLLEFVADCTED